jgi:hypothetical protein
MVGADADLYQFLGDQPRKGEILRDGIASHGVSIPLPRVSGSRRVQRKLSTELRKSPGTATSSLSLGDFEQSKTPGLLVSSTGRA